MQLRSILVSICITAVSLTALPQDIHARNKETNKRLFDHVEVSSKRVKAKRGAYSWSNAYALLVASIFAYEPHPNEGNQRERAIRRFEKIGLKFCGLKQSNSYRGKVPPEARKHAVDPISGKRLKLKETTSARVDTQYYLLYNDAAVVLAFRGSDTYRDWYKTNPKILPANPWDTNRRDYGRVSRGVYWAWAAPRIEDDLVQRIKRCQQRVNPQAKRGARRKSARKLFLTGHSLGGAIAQLAAFDLAHSFKMNISGIYTYGQPRWAAGKAMARSYTQKLKDVSHRWVNADDIVTGVPKPPLHRHVGRLHHLKRTSPGKRQVKLDAKGMGARAPNHVQHDQLKYAKWIWEKMPSKVRSRLTSKSAPGKMKKLFYKQ